MKTAERNRKSAWLTERLAGWVLAAAVFGPLLVGAAAIFFLHQREAAERPPRSLPAVSPLALNREPQASRRPIDAKLLGILIHPTDAKQSSARIASSNASGTFLVGDVVAGGVVEAINSDNVVLRVGPEAHVLGLSSSQERPAAPKVDHKANLELARQMPGFIQVGEPNPDAKPPARGEGNEAFRAFIQKAREASKQ